VPLTHKVIEKLRFPHIFFQILIRKSFEKPFFLFLVFKIQKYKILKMNILYIIEEKFSPTCFCIKKSCIFASSKQTKVR